MTKVNSSRSMLTVEMGLLVLTPMDATWLRHAFNTLNRYLRALYVDFNITVDNTVHYYSYNYIKKMLVVNTTSICVCYTICNM